MRSGVLSEAANASARRAARWREGGLPSPPRFAGPPPPFLPPSDACGIIAEIKRRSPSAGELLGERDPLALAQGYQSAGAEAVSVVVEEDLFGGSVELFAAVRDRIGLPMLWKDFVVDPIQVEVAARMGASAVLLIARLLPGGTLREMILRARGAGLRPLVEVHSEPEAKDALAAGADLVGVNHRNLDTLKMDLSLSAQLAPALGAVTRVAESGLSGPEDIRAMRDLGYRATLVGATLVTAQDPAGALAAMVRAGRREEKAP